MKRMLKLAERGGGERGFVGRESRGSYFFRAKGSETTAADWQQRSAGRSLGMLDSWRMDEGTADGGTGRDVDGSEK